MGVKYTEEQKRLIDAARTGDIKALSAIIESGYNTDCELKYGSSALMIAASRGHAEAVELLIRNGGKINRRNKFGGTALMEAVDKGHHDTVRVLVRMGAELNLPHNNGNTVLLAATLKRDIKTLRILLELGADVTIKNFEGWTPISWSRSESNDELLQVFREFGLIDEKRVEPLTEAEMNEPAIAAKRAAGTARDAFWAAFMRAASAGDTRALNQLVEDSGVEVNAQSPNGTTALIAAVKNGHKDAACQLIELGADLNIPDYDGMTALCWAAKRGDVPVVKELLNSGAELKPEATDAPLKEPVSIAASEGHYEVVEILRKRPVPQIDCCQ